MMKTNSKAEYEAMLNKLNLLFDRKESLQKELIQIMEDIELLETLIMYKYNRTERKR